ncbi:hypothetical protein [Azospirillum thermophilum]|uniref:Phytanoyl-CoA dioxygenase n=1 Tax=Azospirillum thermophilum TaxID=2202148 RepID=A0A2S2CPX3_9PROT|nr:hypothetical protein [Azospirillum thermophilum]AWK86485.1 hypothetical protein DEW08_09745 [Azospirillum thermophilum]
MNVANIARRLAAGELHYALGRFESVRRGFSALRRLRSARSRAPLGPPVPLPPLPTSLFGGTTATRALDDLRRDSIAFGFDLPAPLVADLVEFAEHSPLRARGGEHLFFRSQVQDGRLPDGRPVVIASVPDPLENAAVRRICRDPLLLESCTAFLGYQPRKIIPRLFWSFVTSASDDERRRLGQTIDWHFDVHDLNFCSAQFYLTDVAAGTGAHALVRGSHRGKSLRMLLGSANASDAEVFARYSRDRILVVEGKAGTGFIEDTSCYHKALAPADRDRLMLQLWIS